MRQLFTILIFLFFSNICKSQNDTIYIEHNYLVFNGKKWNHVENNIKNGMWLEYETYNLFVDITMGSGDNYHVCETVDVKYRALRPQEYYGIKYLLSRKCDTINNVVYCDENYEKIVNKISPSVHRITGKGKYDNNRKENLWSYYYLNGEFKKEIFYEKGIPLQNFKIYRNDKSVLMEIRRINEIDWEICKYSVTGEKLDYKICNVEDLKELY